MASYHVSVNKALTASQRDLIDHKEHCSADPDLLYNQIIRPWKSRLALAYLDHSCVKLDLRILELTLLAAFSRRRALDEVARLLTVWDADPRLRRAASRMAPLSPWPPPGANEIVSRYPRAEAAGA